jgi:hypothetical protein
MNNQVYYFDIAEGRWRGEFSFRIERWREFVSAPISLIDRTLALLLHVNGMLPGRTAMEGEILGAPDEGSCGVARVEVSVTRFGLEIFRLSGHYALERDGTGVDIAVLERFGPPGFPVRGPDRRTAVIDREGYRAKYTITSLGASWEGVYDLSSARDRLDAEYRSAWGTIGEKMDRAVRVVPLDSEARRRWERLLDIARRLEGLNRKFDDGADPHSSFAHVYSVITRNLAYSLDGSGFDDPDWVIRLAEHFSDHYFAAVEAQRKGIAPRGWSLVLDAISRHRFTPLEEFALQMYVHIVHDLPRALVKAGFGKERISDYHRVNGLLAAAIDDLQERLGRRYQLAILVVDRLLLRHDEKFAADSIAGSRKSAWYDAERMLDPETKRQVIAEIDARISTVVKLAVGETIPMRIVLAAMRSGLRAMRLKPMNPPPASSLGSTAREPKRDPTAAAVYSMFTAIAAKQRRADLPALIEALSDVQTKIGHRSSSRLLALAGTDWRGEIPRVLERSPTARYTLAALIGELADGRDLDRSLEELRVSVKEHAAILAFQKSATDATAAALEALGIPAHLPLLAFSQLHTRYDPDTKIFSTTVPALFRIPFDEIQHVIAPADWDESIHQVVDTHWIVPDRILYEEVNVLHPWLAEHPLHLRSHLTIDETRTATERRVKYALHESVDDSLDMDQGYIAVESLGPCLSRVTIEKSLRVKNNPLLFAMLRFNPDGLSALLCSWIHEASLRRMPSAA